MKDSNNLIKSRFFFILLFIFSKFIDILFVKFYQAKEIYYYGLQTLIKWGPTWKNFKLLMPSS